MSIVADHTRKPGEAVVRFDLSTRLGRVKAWCYAMVVEHNFTNVLRLVFHRLADDAYRSAQPTMGQLERYARKHGIRTIVNLKGCRPDSPYYAFEVETCRKLGIRLIDVTIASRCFPEPAQLRQAGAVRREWLEGDLDSLGAMTEDGLASYQDLSMKEKGLLGMGSRDILDLDGKVQTLARNGNVPDVAAKLTGLLDEPSEALVRGDEVIVANSFQK